MLLIQVARHVRLNSLEQYDIILGPFQLGSLAKRATDSGFTISIHLSKGILFYLVCWGACGYIWSYILRRSRMKA